MKVFLVFLYFMAFIFIGCEDETWNRGDPGPLESDIIFNNQIVMQSNTDRIMFNSPFRITEKCMPMYTVKGRLYFQLIEGRGGVKIHSPINDTIFFVYQHKSIEVIMIENQEFIQHWDIRLFPDGNNEFAFDTFFYADSILIHGEFYGIDSDTAHTYSPNGYHFRHLTRSESPITLQKAMEW